MKVFSVVSVFKNVWEMSTAKNYSPVNIFSVLSKVFEKLVNNSLVYHLEKYRLFSDFQYDFRFSCSSADLLTVLTLLNKLSFMDLDLERKLNSAK